MCFRHIVLASKDSHRSEVDVSPGRYWQLYEVEALAVY